MKSNGETDGAYLASNARTHPLASNPYPRPGECNYNHNDGGTLGRAPSHSLSHKVPGFSSTLPAPSQRLAGIGGNAGFEERRETLKPAWLIRLPTCSPRASASRRTSRTAERPRPRTPHWAVASGKTALGGRRRTTTSLAAAMEES